MFYMHDFQIFLQFLFHIFASIFRGFNTHFEGLLFQKTFYTTMETVLGFSQKKLPELFRYYDFSTKKYLNFYLYDAECQIQKI